MNKTFKAVAPQDFRERMIASWVQSEKSDRDTVMGYYGGEAFDHLCDRLIGAELEYMVDENPHSEEEDSTCFEALDNNFVIPIDILIITERSA